MSENSLDKSNGNTLTPTQFSPCASRGSDRSDLKEDLEKEERGRVETSKSATIVMEKVRNLKKKPSRFKINFWKRSKSASPPVPAGGPEDVGMGMNRRPSPL